MLNHIESFSPKHSSTPLVFTEVVDKWKDMVYNTALGIVQNEEDAEDITQEVFLKLYESLDEFRHEASVSTWIYRITISKAFDFERRKKRQKRGGLLKRIFDPIEAEDAVSFDHPGVQLDQKENAAVLFNAMKKLPENQQTAFMLQKIESLSNDEIASIMDLSVSAVESLQSRAKQQLRIILREYYENHFK